MFSGFHDGLDFQLNLVSWYISTYPTKFPWVTISKQLCSLQQHIFIVSQSRCSILAWKVLWSRTRLSAHIIILRTRSPGLCWVLHFRVSFESFNQGVGLGYSLTLSFSWGKKSSSRATWLLAASRLRLWDRPWFLAQLEALLTSSSHGFLNRAAHDTPGFFRASWESLLERQCSNLM